MLPCAALPRHPAYSCNAGRSRDACLCPPSAVANAPKTEFPILGGVYWGEPQTVDKAPGDIGGAGWTRYDDPEVKAFKLNAERNNGRAAMMGIIGMMIHEGLTGNPIWPIDYEPGNFPLIPLAAVWPGIFSMGNPYPTI